ncbi:MAG: hypothetical protein JNL32_13220 [Candidatus Kapabacteria bacterium]|nr:hypothetical protein [Candidatus Kapabacteria bacterium]
MIIPPADGTAPFPSPNPPLAGKRSPPLSKRSCVTLPTNTLTYRRSVARLYKPYSLSTSDG